MIIKYKDKSPKMSDTVFVEESAKVIGDVEIGQYSSIWFNTVVRGDVNFIRIGKKTNIQDGCMLHVTTKLYPLIIGDEVTVGHGAVIHGCNIGNLCLIGMGAVLLDNSSVGEGSIIAAGSLVTENTEIPPGNLALGVPARPKRRITEKELKDITISANNYLELAYTYMEK